MKRRRGWRWRKMDDPIFFEDAPDADPIDDIRYRLRRAYVYNTLSGVRVFIPVDFKTDLLSAPRVMWTLTGLSPDGLYRSAAVVHDYLYSLQGALPDLPAPYSRKDCDDILLEIMTRVKIPWLQRKAAYAAVRLFGSTHWKS